MRIADPEPVARLRLSVFDTYLGLAPRTLDPALPVRIVDIDDASLAPRRAVAVAAHAPCRNHCAAAAGRRAHDHARPDPRRAGPAVARRVRQAVCATPQLAPLVGQASALPSNDERLAEVIAQSPGRARACGRHGGRKPPPAPHAHFAFAGDDPQGFVPRFQRCSCKACRCSPSARQGLGAVNWLPVRDQVVRRVPLLSPIGGTLYPSLPLETLRVALHETTVFVRASGAAAWRPSGSARAWKVCASAQPCCRPTATAKCGCASRAPTARRYISAHRILDGSYDGKADRRARRAHRHERGGAARSESDAARCRGAGRRDARAGAGADAVGRSPEPSRVRHRRRARLPRRRGSGASSLADPPARGAVPRRSSAWRRSLPSSPAPGSPIARAGYLFDPVYPSLAILLVYLAASLNGYIATERERSRVRSAFGHYVAAPLVEELARNHDKLKLGGETREVTVLFADVRGFTQHRRRAERRGADRASSTGCLRRCRTSSSPSAERSTNSWATR